MSIAQRIKPALSAGFKHLLASILVAALVAGLVFGLWYPSPYAQLAGGFALFGLIIAVDVVCGPLLTCIVFDPKKPRSELTRDIALIVVLQLTALAYGLYSAAKARPIFLAYEGNRFRVVSMADVDQSKLPLALPEFQSPSYTGPKLVGTKLTEPTDPNFKESITLSMQGHHPSFRPERWVPYESLTSQLQEALQPIAVLKAKHPEATAQIEEVLLKNQLTNESAGYLPLESEKANPADWVVIVDRLSGQPKAFLPLDGW
ncbi:MAG: TfpX/TfpZ family type IV pilin accessory protein [Brachymonas sp.]|nr:TfpX/TfpZ family type IV pilin accessory protein [Brachymonas sp.]